MNFWRDLRKKLNFRDPPESIKSFDARLPKQIVNVPDRCRELEQKYKSSQNLDALEGREQIDGTRIWLYRKNHGGWIIKGDIWSMRLKLKNKWIR